MNDITEDAIHPDASLKQTDKLDAPPSVSVVIPTYNGERWISDAIESVLSQSMSDFEIIVTDDASTDNTVSVARQYESDSRLQIHTFDENLGLGGNWNRGLKLASGTFVKVLCQDDLLLEGCLEESVSVMKRTPSVSLITSYGRVFGDIDKIRDGSIIPVIGEVIGRRAQQLVIEKENWIGAPTAVMFRREDLRKIGYFDNSLPCSLDWEMWLRLLRDGNLFVHTSLLHATRFHGGKESMQCIQNLGFEKDRVTILSRLNDGENRYGNWQQADYQQAWTHAVRSLFRAAKNRKNVSISSIFSFLSQYQSVLTTTGMFVRLVLRDFIYRFMKLNRPSSPQPEAS